MLVRVLERRVLISAIGPSSRKGSALSRSQTRLFRLGYKAVCQRSNEDYMEIQLTSVSPSLFCYKSRPTVYACLSHSSRSFTACRRCHHRLSAARHHLTTWYTHGVELPCNHNRPWSSSICPVERFHFQLKGIRDKSSTEKRFFIRRKNTTGQ